MVQMLALFGVLQDPLPVPDLYRAFELPLNNEITS
jgi:hypothetical protein